MSGPLCAVIAVRSRVKKLSNGCTTRLMWMLGCAAFHCLTSAAIAASGLPQSHSVSVTGPLEVLPPPVEPPLHAARATAIAAARAPASNGMILRVLRATISISHRQAAAGVAGGPRRRAGRGAGTPRAVSRALHRLRAGDACPAPGAALFFCFVI